MLNQQKAVTALQSKRDKFQLFQAEQKRQVSQAKDKLSLFSALSSAEVGRRLAETKAVWPGAEPTTELDQAEQLHFPFKQTWRSHEDARAWALSILTGRPVAAVDGSQIMPSKEFSLPVGAIQVGWFVNYHTPDIRHEKDVLFEVLAPDELAGEELRDGEFSDWRVNQRRFVAECEQICALMERFANEPEAQRPLFFFDGSFIISFAGLLRPERSAPYITAVRKVLATSQNLRVPIVGFVDSSAGKDFLNLLNLVTGQPYLSLTDGALLADRLPNWGDRSPLFVCARNDGLSTHDMADFYRDVVFCYVHLANERAPARIEMPRWLWEERKSDQVLDIVRAECIVSANGYPYPAESADAVAVLQQVDREHFLSLLQQFAKHEGLDLSQSRKSLSKLARR